MTVTLTGSNLLACTDEQFKVIFESKREEFRVLTTVKEAEDIQARARALGLEE